MKSGGFGRHAAKLAGRSATSRKLLLLTAQRRDEVANMEWTEIDLGKATWTMPRAKTKNDRGHEVQLSILALEILEASPRVGDGLVFTTTGETSVSGFSRAKQRLDAAMIRARRRSLGLPDDCLRKFRIGPCTTCAARRPPAWRGSISAARRRQGAQPCERHDPRRGGGLQSVRIS